MDASAARTRAAVPFTITVPVTVTVAVGTTRVATAATGATAGSTSGDCGQWPLHAQLPRTVGEITAPPARAVLGSVVVLAQLCTSRHKGNRRRETTHSHRATATATATATRLCHRTLVL